VTRSLLALPLALAAACAPPPPTPPEPATATAEVATPEPPTPRSPAAAAPPAAPAPPPRALRTTIDDIELLGVRFDSRSHRLVVADQAGGPGSTWPDSRAAGRQRGAIAAINGGFFTPQGEPLGLVVSDGDRRGALNRASSLGAGFVTDDDGRLELLRRDRFDGADEALQSGPFLVENGRPVAGLDDERRAARSFVAGDGATRWVIARSDSCTLAELARALADSTALGFRPASALNLDGGRSAEVWISPAVDGGPAFTRPLWNKPVRNFLLLQPR